MRVGETDPEFRRILVLVYLDDGVTPATDADTLPPGAYEVSLNGATPAAASGTLVGDGTGEYYYEASAGEVASSGFLAFKLEWPGYNTVWEIADVGDLFTVGETDPLKLRLPLFIRDDQEPPQPALTTITVASQLKTSFNNVSFTNALGSLHQVSVGLHYYQALAAEAASEGLLVVKFQKTGFQTEVVFTPVSSPSSGGSGSVFLVSITPEPDVAPGDPGGFPSGVDVASLTHVIAVLGNAASNLDQVFVTATVDGVEEVVYYGGLFRGRYLSSSQSTLGDQVTLDIARTGGWSRTAGEMTITIEGISPSLFHLLLPSSVVDPGLSTAVVSPTSGAIDHATEAVSRLPAQFRKPNIETLLAALCVSIQTFENAAVAVLDGLDLNTATGFLLRALARRAGQPTEGFTDDEVLRRFTRARVAANKSSGTTSDLIRVTRLVINSPGTSVHAETRSIATVVITLGDTSTDPSVVTTLLLFLGLAKKAGVRLKVVYTASSPIFRFNTGPGFNVGHLATSAE